MYKRQAAAVGLGDAGGGVRGFIGVDVFVSAGVGVDVVVAVVDVDNGVYVEVVVVGIHVGGVGDVGAGNQMFCNLLLQVDDKAIAPAVAIIYRCCCRRPRILLLQNGETRDYLRPKREGTVSPR